MTPEEQEQQAQTIAEIDERLKNPWGHDSGTFINDCEILREMIDSKSQKIAELEKEVARLKPKQYTENQIYDLFNDQLMPKGLLSSFVTENGLYVSGLHEYALKGWIACARALGVLKE